MMIARLIKVTGRVQGVFFRDRTKAKADELGVLGWVKNCDDGSVEIHAEGGEDAVASLIEWCHRGPPAAKVERVEVGEAESESPSGFESIW